VRHRSGEAHRIWSCGRLAIQSLIDRLKRPFRLGPDRRDRNRQINDQITS
jgi:hypothetical protein